MYILIQSPQFTCSFVKIHYVYIVLITKSVIKSLFPIGDKMFNSSITDLVLSRKVHFMKP